MKQGRGKGRIDKQSSKEHEYFILLGTSVASWGNVEVTFVRTEAGRSPLSMMNKLKPTEKVPIFWCAAGRQSRQARTQYVVMPRPKNEPATSERGSNSKHLRERERGRPSKTVVNIQLGRCQSLPSYLACLAETVKNSLYPPRYFTNPPVQWSISAESSTRS